MTSRAACHALIAYFFIVCCPFTSPAQTPDDGVAGRFFTDSPMVNGDIKLVVAKCSGSVLMGQWNWSGNAATLANWIFVGAAPIDPQDSITSIMPTTSPHVNDTMFVIFLSRVGVVLTARWEWTDAHTATLIDWATAGNVPTASPDGIAEFFFTDSPDVNGDSKFVAIDNSGVVHMGEWQWSGATASVAGWSIVGVAPENPVSANTNSFGAVKSMFR